ncbi:FtsX-like permease family protein [Kitasatospora camelliae]|uniref:FtsX-like permease family protein n=1 Tax=Kitasatospora camelliae TaxID=3156397 RepID=A0AAU8JS70_9ACTN
MRAALRWIRADLRTHRLPALLVVLATAGTAAALLLAGALLDSVSGPWQRQFARADGAHVWVETRADHADTTLAVLPGVTGVAGPYPTATARLTARDGTPVTGPPPTLGLRAADADPAALSHPLRNTGRWLDPAHPDGIVLERSLADSALLHAGDRITVRGDDGREHALTVLGTADSPDRARYPDLRPGLGWVLPGTLDLVQPDPARRGHAVGLRLDHPADADYTAQRAVTALGGDQVTHVATWTDARDSHERESRPAGLLLGLCGLAALLAAALAVAGAAGDRIRARRGDIATLKALGFTPAGIARMFVLQHLLLAGLGLLLGTAGALAAARLLPALTPDPAGTASPWNAWRDLLGTGPAALLAALGCLGAVALASAIPALRAARVAALPPAEGPPADDRPPRAARLTLLRHLPPALVLGVRGALRGRGRTALAVLRLAVPVTACTLALTTWSTLDGLDPAAGTPSAAGSRTATLTVRAATTPDPLLGELATRPEIAGVHPGAEREALAPGQSATVTLRALGTTAHPYPYTLADGRTVRAANEAVAGQGALDLLGVHVGQWARVTTDGTPRILHIVGRIVEPDRGGRVVSTTMETLADADTPQPRPEYYTLTLRPGTDPARLAADLAATHPGRLDPRPATPLAELPTLRAAVVGLVVLLALITLAELLTLAATALRAHRQDLALLRTIGLTPRQATALVVTRSATVALLGVLVGVAAGLPLALALIDDQAAATGVGAGLAHAPGALALALLLAATLAGAAAASAVPARRASREPPGEVLHRL